MKRRIKRVNQLLKSEVSKILLREVESPKNTLITVTKVQATPDLRKAKVFLSIIPKENEEKIFSFLQKRIYRIQQGINKKLKMKIVPKIIFAKEKTAEKAARIEQLLGELKRQKKEIL